MGGKLGVGFCPTCGKEAPSQIAAKFAAAADSDEIDMFAYAYGAGTETSFAPYCTFHVSLGEGNTPNLYYYTPHLHFFTKRSLRKFGSGL